MKGTILSGVLAASLLLTGCASMLTREYGSVEPHSATLVSEGDANTLRAESYQDVVNGLIYFINRGAESGSIRFDGEEPDVRALLDEACLEVVQEDPLGAYAVEYIKYNVAPIVGSYEADVHITYRRSREQVAAITDATGASAIRSELSEALAAFSPEVVLRISYFEEDEAYLRQLVREAYLSDPASALGMPEAEIAMYPESGPRRIVEILLDKLVRASKDTGIRDIAIAGGVSANSGLRNGIVEQGLKRGWRTFLPEFKFTTDNAAMIAMAGYYHYQHGDFSSLGVSPVARLQEL